MKNKIKKLLNKNETIEKGEKTLVENQHKAGKLTARERIGLLLDEGSFMELGKYAGSSINDQDSLDNLVTGYGTVDGRLVYVYGQDHTQNKGAMNHIQAKKICDIQEMALKMGAPIISLLDSSGAKIEEGLGLLSNFGKILYNKTISSGVIPQISLVAGPCVGSGSFNPAISDFVFMVDKTSHIYLNSPQVIRGSAEDEINKEDLGGAMVNNKLTGIADFIDESEADSINRLRELLSFLPSNNLEEAPIYETYDDINRVEDRLNEISTIGDEAYDVKEVIQLIADEGYFFEVKASYAENIVTGYIRLNGQTVAIVANQSKALQGKIDKNGAHKAAKFIGLCNSFNIPILSLVDVEGFIVSKEEEYAGLVNYGANLVFAYGEATVPKLSLIIGKAYGSGYLAMGSKDLGVDQVFAWPAAEIAVMDPEGVANIIYSEEIANSANPVETRKSKISEYKENETNPYAAARKGFIDDILIPSTSRPRIIAALDMLTTKRESRPAKKHGNQPV